MPRLRSKRTLGQRHGTIDTVFVALAVEAAAPENLWFPWCPPQRDEWGTPNKRSLFEPMSRLQNPKGFPKEKILY